MDTFIQPADAQIVIEQAQEFLNVARQYLQKNGNCLRTDIRRATFMSPESKFSNALLQTRLESRATVAS
jgi:hypothetical protein